MKPVSTTSATSYAASRANLMVNEAASEKAFTKRAFAVIATIFLLAWVVTG